MIHVVDHLDTEMFHSVSQAVYDSKYVSLQTMNNILKKEKFNLPVYDERLFEFLSETPDTIGYTQLCPNDIVFVCGNSYFGGLNIQLLRIQGIARPVFYN